MPRVIAFAAVLTLMHRVNRVCIRAHARRAASRCARGVTC